MMPDNFDKKLLKEKKERFVECVKRTAKKLGVLIPKVKFWDCPYNPGNHLAHIHLELLQICVSERHLAQMTFDEIEDTASHEVEHLRDKNLETDPTHSSDFYNRHSDTKRKIWKPPAGVVQVRHDEKLEVYPKEKKTKPSKKECNFHSCKEKTNLSKCECCEKYFCEDHIEPTETSIGHPSNRISLGQSNFNNGHPCPDFSILDYDKRALIEKIMDWKKEIIEIDKENKKRLAEWEKSKKEWEKECNKICAENVKEVKKWKVECKNIEKKITEANKKLEQDYKNEIKKWASKCKKIKNKYEQKLKSWEDDCNNSKLGSIKKLLKINKPKEEELPSNPSLTVN